MAEEEEDLFANLGDLDKVISISLAVDDKGKGPSTMSKLEIQSTMVKDSLPASTIPSSSTNPHILTSTLR